MKQNIFKLFLVVFIFTAFLFSFNYVFAAPDSATGGGLPNPLGAGNDDPRVIIGNIIKAGLGIVGSLALATFVLGGFFWVTSAGNEEKIKKGKDMILWASFGLAVIFFSYALVTFVINAVAGGSGGSGTDGRPGQFSEDDLGGWLGP